MAKTVTVFGCSATRAGSAEYGLAEKLGRLLAERGARVCCGGYTGIMEAVSKGASEAGGVVVGVTCREVFAARTVNGYVTDEISEPNLTRRLLRLVQLGDAYVCLPGSTGTLAELFYTWNQMNVGDLRRKPLVLLGEEWPPLISLLQASAMLERGLESRVFLSRTARQAAQQAVATRDR